MRDAPKTVRLFESDGLERLSRVHPAVPLVLWAPIIAWLLRRSVAVHEMSIAAIAALGAAGLLVWTLTEYLVHRFVFHLAPTTPRRRRLQFIVHGVHHAAPDDPRRLLMPPVPALLAAGIFYVGSRAVLGPVWSEPFLAFFLLGYLAYDYVHLALHHRRLPGRIGRRLWREHMLHHHATPEARWGVSSPLWDHVFGSRGMVGLGGRGWTALLVVLGLVAAMAPSLPAVGADAEWQPISNRDGILIERRAHDGASVYELRATAHSPLAPAAIFETIWRQGEHTQFVPYLKRLDLLSDTGDERVTYEQVAVPLAKDRDYTVRLRRQVDQDVQRYEVVFTNANEAGPPPDRGHVRVSLIRGRWRVEPDGKGAKISYEVLSEPGGAIPSWIINRVQGEATAKLIRAILQRAKDKSK